MQHKVPWSKQMSLGEVGRRRTRSAWSQVGDVVPGKTKLDINKTEAGLVM